GWTGWELQRQGQRQLERGVVELVRRDDLRVRREKGAFEFAQFAAGKHNLDLIAVEALDFSFTVFGDVNLLTGPQTRHFVGGRRSGLSSTRGTIAATQGAATCHSAGRRHASHVAHRKPEATSGP
ncbi:MAG TPA: hypothetical protein VFJ02_24895, partial [Vicinamibacterales bacterium]|nr:hypothetical protein [Vicinamibacterales bacterium]